MQAMEHRGCKAPLLTSAQCKVLHSTSEQAATATLRSPMSYDVEVKLRSLDKSLQELKASITAMSNTQQYMLQMLHLAGNYEAYSLSAAPLSSQPYPTWSSGSWQWPQEDMPVQPPATLWHQKPQVQQGPVPSCPFWQWQQEEVPVQQPAAPRYQEQPPVQQAPESPSCPSPSQASCGAELSAAPKGNGSATASTVARQALAPTGSSHKEPDAQAAHSLCPIKVLQPLPLVQIPELTALCAQVAGTGRYCGLL